MKTKTIFAFLLGWRWRCPRWHRMTVESSKTPKTQLTPRQAAKKTGHKIKKGTKKVVHKGAKHTEHGAERVEDKTKPSPTPLPR